MTWYHVLPFSAFLASPVFGQLLSETDPSLPGNAPKLEVGITTCEDGSRWHAFIYKTIAGLPYVVESGNDLTGWSEEDSIYGFGQEEVVIMKQAPALPAPPPPGTYRTPPPMIRVPAAQIIMRRGTTGGLILSWKSLDDTSAKIVFLPGLTQDPGWINMPGYVRRFGGYDFYLCNPLLPQVPPSTNSTLGPLDTAMVAAFETNFPTMNAEVAAAVVRARTAPRIPAPPTEKRFWRVRVNWNLDSDFDGTPDWMEFAQLFAAGAGNNTVAGPESDPFNMDVNEDGIADGGQRSSDGDTIPDSLDADNTDGMIDWQKTPEYRYAFFQVSSESLQYPLSVDDFGDVLFQSGQWVGGTYHSLGEGSWALVGNDRGNILGTITTDGISSNLMRWNSSTSTPVAVVCGDLIAGLSTVTAGQPGGPIPNGQWYYSRDGSFIADANKYVTGEYGDPVLTFQHRAKWNFNPITEAITESPVDNETQGISDSGHLWGLDLDSPVLPVPTFIKSPGGAKETWQWSPFSHVTAMSSGTIIVSGGSDQQLRVQRQGMWPSPRRLKKAIEISPEGIAIKQDPSPFWMNGRDRDIPTMAPEYSGNPLIFPFDISAEGCIVALDQGGACDPFLISGMPFSLESMHGGPYGKSLGVDNVSVGSDQPGAAGDKQWIMVPEGHAETVVVRSAASLSHGLKISGTGVEVNGTNEVTLGIHE